jgi:hypothetical protein
MDVRAVFSATAAIAVRVREPQEGRGMSWVQRREEFVLSVLWGLSESSDFLGG